MFGEVYLHGFTYSVILHLHFLLLCRDSAEGVLQFTVCHEKLDSEVTNNA